MDFAPEPCEVSKSLKTNGFCFRTEGIYTTKSRDSVQKLNLQTQQMFASVLSLRATALQNRISVIQVRDQ